MGAVLVDGDSSLLTQSYYDSLSGAASVGPAPSATNINLIPNASVILQQTVSDVISDINTTTREYIGGGDNETVFTFMYGVSISGYVVNATLFFTICCRRKFRRATNYLLANLCISSILFLMAVNIRVIERAYGPIWTYNEINCILWSVIRRIPQALASLTIVAISCDRSQAARILVNRPCSSDMTKKILRIWIIAVLTTLPRGFLWSYNQDLETSVLAYKCSSVEVGPHGIFNLLYAFFHMISIFMLPMCILICDIYSTIQKIVFLKSRQTSLNCQQQHCHHHQDTQEQQNTQLHKKQLQLLRNSCIFAASFMICWLPWGIYQQLGDLPKSIVSPEFRYLIWVHFNTIRYLPFTVTAFLPLLLVVCTYDANTFGCWRKCFRRETCSNAPGDENYRPNDLLGRAGGCRGHQRMELLQNRPRFLVNNVHNHHHHHPHREHVEENNENNV